MVATAGRIYITDDQVLYPIDVLDASTGQLIVTLEDEGLQNINGMVWSPDSSQLAVSDRASNIYIWNVSMGQSIILARYGPASVDDLSWSPAGTMVIASIGAGLLSWDPVTGEELSDFLIPNSIAGVAWNNDGSRLAVGGASYFTVRDATSPDWLIVTEFDAGHAVGSLAWSPDGLRIAVGGSDGLYVYETDTWQSQNILSGGVGDIAWSPDGNRLAGVVETGSTVYIWDTASWDILEEYQSDNIVYDVAWHPDNTRFFYSDGPDGVYVNGLPLSEFNQPPIVDAGPDRTLTDTDASGSEPVTLDGSASTDPDGTIVSYSWIENDVEIATGVAPTVDLPVGEHTITLTVTDDDGLTASDTVVITVQAVRLSPHAQVDSTIADIQWNVDGSRLATVNRAGTIQLYNGTTHAPTAAFSRDFGAAIAWHPLDPNILAISTFDQGVDIIDVDSVATLYHFDQEALTYSVAFSPDGTQLLTGHGSPFGGSTARGFVRTTTIATGISQLAFEESAQPVFLATWSPDGAYIAGLNAGWHDSVTELVIWDANTGTVVHRISLGKTGIDALGNQILVGDVIDFAWSPDGSTIAVGTSLKVSFWNVPGFDRRLTSEYVFPLRMAWSPDGEVVAVTTGSNQAIHLIDKNTGLIVDTIPTELHVRNVAWNPNGTQLVYTGDTEQTLSFFDIYTLSTASAGPDQTLTDTDSSGSEPVMLDGSASTDPDGTIVGYSWTENDVEIATGITPTVDLPVGEHTITLTVTDDDGLTASDTVVITVQAATTSARVTANLQALYTFDEGGGLLINDVSGVGAPMDLTIDNQYAVTWAADGLTLNSATVIDSRGQSISPPAAHSSRRMP
jgi:WD40 repeat protein